MFTGRSISQEIECPTGYALIRLEKIELERLRTLIRDQWLYRLLLLSPAEVKRFANIEMDHYHELARFIDHSKGWPKTSRILPPSAVCEIRGMPFIKHLESEFGRFEISDEEGIGWEEIYWRLVRPNAPDIGPLHADSWFWEAGHGKTPEGATRVKAWVAIYSEKGKNGLRVIPGSHQGNCPPYHLEHRDGFLKPQIDVDEKDLNIILVPTDPGDGIIFHDKLIHGGARNEGETTRVSLEFTFFVRK